VQERAAERQLQDQAQAAQRLQRLQDRLAVTAHQVQRQRPHLQLLVAQMQRCMGLLAEQRDLAARPRAEGQQPPGAQAPPRGAAPRGAQQEPEALPVVDEDGVEWEEALPVQGRGQQGPGQVGVRGLACCLQRWACCARRVEGPQQRSPGPARPPCAAGRGGG
jgi:hypothetical protein